MRTEKVTGKELVERIDNTSSPNAKLWITRQLIEDILWWRSPYEPDEDWTLENVENLMTTERPLSFLSGFVIEITDDMNRVYLYDDQIKVCYDYSLLGCSEDYNSRGDFYQFLTKAIEEHKHLLGA
jgi:hypothetical protein